MRLSSVEPSDLARRLRSSGIDVVCGPIRMRVRTSLPELVTSIRLLYADFPVAEDANVPDFSVAVEKLPRWRSLKRGMARAVVDGRPAFDPFERRHALPMFEWAVNWCVFTLPSPNLMLHAATVERDGCGLLLSGKPGAGKSTLTAGLAFFGWRVLSDELAIIPPGQTDLLPLPRPVGLKDASIDIVRALWPGIVMGPACRETRKGMVAHMRPPRESVDRADEPARARWVVFPRFREGATPLIRRVSRADALIRLGDESFNYSLLGRSAFETLSTLLEGCDCWELDYGSLPDAVAGIEEITRTLGSGTDARFTPSHDVGGNDGRPDRPVSRFVERRRSQHASYDGHPLLRILRDINIARSLTASDWTELVGMAREARLLGRIALQLGQAAVMADLPPRLESILRGAMAPPQQHARLLRWEVNRIRQAIRGVETKVVLLKGAAYELAGLPPAFGRLSSDVDILVPKRDVQRVEGALLAGGWEHVKLDPYDQRFYRDWTHELPPLKHGRRQSVVDVHHSILPVRGRLRPDPALLLNRALPLSHWNEADPAGSHLWTLSPEDMVLHSAAHLFQDGELAGSLRDLVDLDALLEHFGENATGFWTALVPRARELDLERPLFHALRYSTRMLGTRVEMTRSGTLRSASAVTVKLMDRIVPVSIMPTRRKGGQLAQQAARFLLYMRAHWFRLPPHLLVTHLAHQALRRRSSPSRR